MGVMNSKWKECEESFYVANTREEGGMGAAGTGYDSTISFHSPQAVNEKDLTVTCIIRKTPNKMKNVSPGITNFAKKRKTYSTCNDDKQQTNDEYGFLLCFCSCLHWTLRYCQTAHRNWCRCEYV